MHRKPNDLYRFRFEGGMAEHGELNFYELSRSQYAAARLLYTLARYRETGRVVARLSEKTLTDIRIRAPEQGSFIYDALVFGTVQAATGLATAPLDAIFAMIWDRVLSTGAGYVSIKTQANLEMRRLSRRPKASLSRLERNRLDLLEAVNTDQSVTKQELVGLAEELIDDASARPDGAAERVQSLERIKDDLQLEINREDIMKPHSGLLDQISDEDKRKLFSKSRPLIPEIGLPLRTSAKEMDISVGRDKKRIGWLNAERAAEIAETAPDEDLDRLTGQVIQYNKETGFGKFRIDENENASNEYGNDVGFRILRPLQSNLNSTVIDAIKEKAVVGEFMVTRDKEDKPKSLLLIALRDCDEKE